MSINPHSQSDWAPMASAAQIAEYNAKQQKLKWFVIVPIVIVVLVFAVLGELNIVEFDNVFNLVIGKIACSELLWPYGIHIVLFICLALPALIVFSLHTNRIKEWILILKSRQNPSLGKEVYEPTKITRGMGAYFEPGLGLLAVFVIFPLVLFSSIQLIDTFSESFDSNSAKICSAPLANNS